MVVQFLCIESKQATCHNFLSIQMIDEISITTVTATAPKNVEQIFIQYEAEYNDCIRSGSFPAIIFRCREHV